MQDKFVLELSGKGRNMRFDKKSVVVTGAAGGMGKEIVQHYLAEGAWVLAVDVRKERLEEYQNSLAEKAYPGRLEIYEGDISKLEDAEGMIDEAVKRFGKLDILVNNAGVSGRCEPVGELEDELWNRVLAINLTGTMYAMRKAVRVMLTQKEKGNIVNIASVAGLKGCRASSAYTVSKHGVMALTEHTAYMYLHEGIRVNAVCPGGIHTDMADDHTNESVFGYERVRGGMDPQFVFGETKNIADAVLFLSSEEASFVNGAALVVDGGMSCN